MPRNSFVSEFFYDRNNKDTRRPLHFEIDWNSPSKEIVNTFNRFLHNCNFPSLQFKFSLSAIRRKPALELINSRHWLIASLIRNFIFHMKISHDAG